MSRSRFQPPRNGHSRGVSGDTSIQGIRHEVRLNRTPHLVNLRRPNYSLCSPLSRVSVEAAPCLSPSLGVLRVICSMIAGLWFTWLANGYSVSRRVSDCSPGVRYFDFCVMLVTSGWLRRRRLRSPVRSQIFRLALTPGIGGSRVVVTGELFATSYQVDSGWSLIYFRVT